MNTGFTDWQKFAVHQRRPQSGCIPTGYQMILQWVDAQNIDFPSFQDDFDLDQGLQVGGTPRNNFESVAAEVRKKYPSVCFRRVEFDKTKGDEKLKFVEDRLAKKQPVLVSIANEPFGGHGWHIMPVVDATGDKLTLLKNVDANGTPETCEVSKAELVRIHNQYNGGGDVAYLEKWQ